MLMRNFGMMNLRVVFAVCAALVAASAHADDDSTLLDAFHKYGVTHCDSFILENSRLKGNWHLYINKHDGGIDGPTTEVSIIRIWGSEGDTVKVDQSYIRSPRNCYLTTRSTITFPGTCASNVDGDYWYISNRLPGRDYTTYKNKGGIEMQAKDITVGNHAVCVQETLIRTQAPRSE
jgi:hypothetical protein